MCNKQRFTAFFAKYTKAKNVWGGWCLTGNQGNHRNFDPSLLPKKPWLIFIWMKQNFVFFLIPKWPTRNNWVFQNCQFSIFFQENFRVRPYIGQLDDHLCWAKSMPFASIDFSYTRTKAYDFLERILIIGGLENLSFF